MAYERLLEKKWGDLKHLETERHWFLGAFGVFVASGLAFLVQAGVEKFAGIIFGALAVLSVLGLSNALRVSWVLLLRQNDIIAIVNVWEKVADDASKQITGFWTFVRSEGTSREDGNLSLFLYGATPLFHVRGWRWGWDWLSLPMPLGVRLPPSLSSLYIWLYLACSFTFLCFALPSWCAWLVWLSGLVIPWW